MNSKKIILTIVFLAISGFLFNFGTPTTKAITTVELQAQIQQLLQQITQLQQQLNQMQGEEGTWCHDFRTNLRWGDAGSEVSALQTALEKEGLYEREGDQPPHFDDGVASAVTAFQERYASETLSPWGLSHGTGYVGNTTRAKLNQLYGCTLVLGLLFYYL
jgi:murein L,D-transpeptidase YcbB/YkuD